MTSIGPMKGFSPKPQTELSTCTSKSMASPIGTPRERPFRELTRGKEFTAAMLQTSRSPSRQIPETGRQALYSATIFFVLLLLTLWISEPIRTDGERFILEHRRASELRRSRPARYPTLVDLLASDLMTLLQQERLREHRLTLAH